ncbi:hypothetical protein V8F20_009613 [Naviculisporaceae sp. PSN 640]
MKFSAATVLAAVAGAQAYAYSNVTYTTEVVTAVTTYCPGPTQITYGGETYTVSEATTLTITKCPGGCTISYPVHTVSSVYCNTCSAPGYTNATAPVAPYPTGTVSTAAPAAPTYPAEEPPVTAGAAKAVALSGAALAGVLGFAALL